MGNEKYYDALTDHMEQSIKKATEGIDLNQILFGINLKTNKVYFSTIEDDVAVGFTPSDDNVSDFYEIMNTPRDEE